MSYLAVFVHRACRAGKLDGLAQLFLDGVPDVSVTVDDLSSFNNLSSDEWIHLEAELAWRITRVEARGFTVDEVRRGVLLGARAVQ